MSYLRFDKPGHMPCTLLNSSESPYSVWVLTAAAGKIFAAAIGAKLSHHCCKSTLKPLFELGSRIIRCLVLTRCHRKLGYFTRQLVKNPIVQETEGWEGTPGILVIAPVQCSLVSAGLATALSEDVDKDS